jgi:hypothetical protein
MTIQRPNCMKTFRQGSVSISLFPAARSCAGPHAANHLDLPASGNELPETDVNQITEYDRV